ncbi:MAG TPA: alpha/beta fold hydrolase [Luteitalea sp.]|nr:alpha/beta fold hydrolase [Luteitalea sp.]
MRRASSALGALGLLLLALTFWPLPDLAAGGLVSRSSRPLTRAKPTTCADITFEGQGVRLAGWRCAPTAQRRGAIVYLHGIADNRSGADAVVRRFGPKGFEVIAYDSRAHGTSEGALCTYGVLERHDLRRVIATIAKGPIILIGGSLGAAVALQTAAIEPRVSGVIAAEAFTDLRTVATERGRRLWLPPWTIRRAFPIAERRAGFRIDDASPLAAAAHIHVPTLLLHGADDDETSPAHSRRLATALSGRAQIVLVPGAGHSQTLTAPGVWDRIEQWVLAVLDAEG